MCLAKVSVDLVLSGVKIISDSLGLIVRSIVVGIEVVFKNLTVIILFSHVVWIEFAVVQSSVERNWSLMCSQEWLA